MNDVTKIARPAPLPAGLHEIPPARYHADPAPSPSLSNGLAKRLIHRSAMHAWTASRRLNPDYVPETSREFDIGHAAHRAVLGAGPGWAVYPPSVLGKNGAASTTAAKDWAAEARAHDITPIKAADEEAILDMASAVNEALVGAGVHLQPGRSELTGLAEIDGVWCRALFDNAPTDGDILWDLKTTTDASPDAVRAAIARHSYHLQAAHYTDIWRAITGEDRRFRFVFVEKKAPFGVTIAELHEETLAHARRQIARARLEWRECLQTGVWPSYPLAVVTLELSDFHHDRQLRAEIEREDWRVASGNKPSRAAITAAFAAQAPHR